MKKVLLVCHLVKNKIDGQQAKTIDIANFLKKNGFEIELFNYGNINRFIVVPYFLKKARQSDYILLMPGGKMALKLFSKLSNISRKPTIYFAVGSWVNDLIFEKKYKSLVRDMMHFKKVLLQNKATFSDFRSLGFNNIVYIPTFSSRKSLTQKQFLSSLNAFDNSSSFRFVYFARISKDKGIFDACNAIIEVQKRYPSLEIFLDIYGQFEDNDTQKKVMEICNKSITYKGVLQNDVIKNLSNYYCLLFPTTYYGEGMPHSVIESFMAGLPVISTNWRFLPELIENNKNGLIYNYLDSKGLIDKIEYSINHKDLVMKMRKQCFLKSKDYDSTIILKQVIDCFD